MSDQTSDGDPAMNDALFTDATIVLLMPFVTIPLSIITARVVKLGWKVYQAKKYGYANDVLEDPLAELGLKFRRGYDDTHSIRKIRKEQHRILKEEKNRQDSIAKRQEENERILNPRAENQTAAAIRGALSGMVPIHAAEQYLAQIRSQTQKTWYEKVSPDAVRRWINVSIYARLWMMLQVTCTFLAIINYVLLTYLANKDDRDERTLIKNLDIGYASFFLLDYCLSFYIAEDRLQFYANPMSLIDLLSIVSPFVYLFIASPTKYVWFIGFIRIFRATRIMRTYRILAFAQSEETRELTIFVLNFLNFIFFSASIINATEALNFQPEIASLQNWHDSLYYIMVTFSTIGFGDLTPSSTYSRIVVMFLIILVILYIPWQTGKIIEIFNSMNKYQRAVYSIKADSSHVILAGNVCYSSIVDFCREFFVADGISSVVILSANAPDLNIRRLLNHPFYRNRLLFLQGDLMALQDLKRAKTEYATGMFILCDDLVSVSDEEQETVQAYEGDTQALLRTLFAKTSFPGLPIFAQVNDYRSQDLASHSGVDRIVCVDQLKASVFASNCMCPGIQTLILNLIHTYKDVDPGNMREFWTQEYQCGLVNQIQSFRIPSGLVGLPFVEAAKEIYTAYNTIIFALVSVNSGFNQNHIRFFIEKDYKLKADDIALCIGDGGDEISIRIALHFKEMGVREIIEQRGLEIEMSQFAASTTSTPTAPAPDTPTILMTPSFVDADSASPPISSEFADITLGYIPENLSGHIIVTGNVSARIFQQFVKSIRERSVSARESTLSGAAHRDTPIVFIMERIPEVDENTNSIWNEILSFKSIFIIKGRAVQNQSLLKASIHFCNRIVIFSKQGERSSSADAQSVFLIKLLQKEWPQVKYLVELVDGSNIKYLSSRNLEWDTNNLRMQSIINNYALNLSDRQTLYRTLRTEGQEKQTLIYQILQFMTGKPTEDSKSAAKRAKIAKENNDDGSHVKKSWKYSSLNEEAEESAVPKKEVAITEVYLQRALEETELNDSGLVPFPVYHFDRHFAAGMVASSAFMQTILCQAYFRPFIIDVVLGLINHTYTVPVKPIIAGKRYLEVVHACLSQGLVPIGLFRHGASKTELPYVYTNCRQGDIVNLDDLIFVIRSG